MHDLLCTSCLRCIAGFRCWNSLGDGTETEIAALIHICHQENDQFPIIEIDWPRWAVSLRRVSGVYWLTPFDPMGVENH